LTLRHLTDQALAIFGEAHDGGRGASSFSIRDDDRVASFHHGDNRVGGPKVDTDDFVGHLRPLS